MMPGHGMAPNGNLINNILVYGDNRSDNNSSDMSLPSWVSRCIEQGIPVALGTITTFNL